jgi:pimeloyl-ACP methyl ester carboxylesterase
MNVSGGDLRTLEWSEGPSTDDPCGGGFPWGCDLMHITRPDWSPDGKSIVASTGASGFSDGGRIAILDACSKTPKPLRVLDPAPRFLDNPFYRPAWSPDGTKIVFSDDGFEQDVSEPGGGHFEQDIFVMNADGTGVEPLTDTPGDIWESDPDWQPTRPPDEPPEGCKEDKLPIVFVPGFLGSNIICDVGSAAPKPLWPAIPNPDFLEMSLDSNGTANGNRNRCNRSARPSGQIADIAEGYKNLVNYLDGLPRQVGYYAYDWRKSPLLAVDGLDEKVDKILKKVKTEKVVLMAHSMGGLVVRGYVEAHPSKVDRVVTVGTPFLGAPKPWLALSHGWTTPEPNNLDRIIPNGDLKEFARNATGAYFLYPSEGFVEKIGRWLSVPSVDTLLPADAVPDAVNAYNGNGALLQQAYDSHSSLLEIIPTNGVEWQMVVGTGVQTLMVINENEGSEDPDYVFGNGDGTVPMVSAAMGNINPSAVHYACGVAHGTMSGTREVTKRINGYLMRGDPIKGAPAPCEVP